jgi:prepilin-type N-terminal cleavage/methylation domain-containing protein
MDRSGPGSRGGRRSQRGFNLVELLVVLAMAGVLMAIGMPALLNIGHRYKVHSSAQTLQMLGRQARFESIKLGQPVTVVPDPNNGMFYVISGTLPGSWKAIGDFAPMTRLGVWQVPQGVSFKATGMFAFNSDGSGSGGPVVFSLPNQPSSTVTMTSTATGKLVVQ